MFNKKDLEGIAADNKRWQRIFKESVSKTPERLKRFSTVSDRPIQNLYTPLDLKDLDYSKDIGFPGQYCSRAFLLTGSLPP
jgi:methylmalonyl-CoA mutase N-terminal domain/subunit